MAPDQQPSDNQGLQAGRPHPKRRRVLATGPLGAQAAGRCTGGPSGPGANRRGSQRSRWRHYRPQGIRRCHLQRKVYRICLGRRLSKEVCDTYYMYVTLFRKTFLCLPTECHVGHGWLEKKEHVLDIDPQGSLTLFIRVVFIKLDGRFEWHT